jgi:hypothetical protein
MVWNRVRFACSLVVIAAAVGTGCAHGGRQIQSQPFRDETEPDGFQYYESAVPSSDDDGGEKSGAESTSETTIEIDIDEDSQGGSSGASAGSSAGGEDAPADSGDDGSSDGDDGSDEDAAGSGPSAAR